MTSFAPSHLIFGAGSIGCYLGGRLQQGGAELRFFGRKPMEGVLSVQGLSLTHHERAPFSITGRALDYETQLDRLSPPTMIHLCVKSQDTEAAARQIAAMGWRCCVVSWQNGIGNAALLRRLLPNNIIIAAMVPFNITQPQDGTFHCGTGGALHIGAGPGVDGLKAALAVAQEPLVVTPEITAYQWGKLIINLNNALNTLMGSSLRAGFMDRHYRRALAASWEEALLIIQSAGIEPKFFNGMAPQKFIRLLRLPNFLFAPIFSRLIKMDRAARSSMLDDLDAGKMSEIDYLQGALLKQAADIDRAAPINQRLYNAVNAAFESGISPKMSGREIWALVEGGSVANLK